MIQLSKYAKLLVEEESVNNITDDMRIVMNKTPIELDINRKYKQSIEMKPRGFWYGFGTAWIDWCKSDMPHWVGEYIYTVDVGNSNILKINSMLELIEFTKQYEKDKYPALPFIGRHDFIDWVSVSDKYDGIEITPYQWHARFDYMWYYGWDVASGCIWNLKNVKLTPINYSV